jgi:hypothetical protein
MVNAIISIGWISIFMSVMKGMAMTARKSLLPTMGIEGSLLFRGYRYEKMWGRYGASGA